MKPTEKQLAANRQNATKSTGPITPAGRAIAARNSLKHGLLAQEVVVDAGEGAESREQFDALLLDLKNQFDPQGVLEEILVEKMAVAYWRLRRAHRYEVGLIRQKLDNATDEYYRADPFGLDPYSDRSRASLIDGAIRSAQEQRQVWRNDRDRFATMHQDGKDLQETYRWQDNCGTCCTRPWQKPNPTRRKDRPRRSENLCSRPAGPTIRFGRPSWIFVPKR